MLDEELCAFDPELAEKPQIRVINKIDILPAERLAALRANASADVLFVSALTGDGLPALLDEMWRRMGDAGALEDDDGDGDGVDSDGPQAGESFDAEEGR